MKPKTQSCLLGMLLAVGFIFGLADNRAGAASFEETKTLALTGDAEAEFRLGGMFAQGEKVADDDEATRWFQQAASRAMPRRNPNSTSCAQRPGRGAAG